MKRRYSSNNCGTKEMDREKYKLENPRTYHYLNQYDCFELDGIDDAKEYLATQRAMEVVGLSPGEQKRWEDMFPCLIARATTTYIISSGMGGTRDSALPLTGVAELPITERFLPQQTILDRPKSFEAYNYVKYEVWHAFIVVITNAPVLQGYTIRSLYSAFQMAFEQESLAPIVVWCIGEYREMLINGAGMLQGEEPITLG